MTTEIEVGDLVCYGSDRKYPYRVYGFNSCGLVLCASIEYDNVELEVFPENLTVVYTFFDLCRAWEDAKERMGVNVAWEKYYDEIWPDWFLYVVCRLHDGMGPLPRHLAYLYSWATEC